VSDEQRALVSGFLRSAERFPDRPALSIKDREWCYAELVDHGAALAATLDGCADDGSRLSGVFGHRSLAAFSGVLGALMRGDGYVPLNPTFPPERTAAMVNRAALTRIVAEAASLKHLAAVLPLLERPPTIVVPDADGPPDGFEAGPANRVLWRGDLRAAGDWRQPAPDPDALAYLLFTSGSTGQPKGVMVAQRNVTAFVDFMADRYGVDEHDRLSQTFDLTFDLSAFDMFLAWERGACVCCPTQGEKLFPNKYVDSQRLTIWFSVPSTAILMKKMKMLTPDRYPGLRYSLFCGEALPLEVTEAFQQAAPNSIVENLYGPTELTIACTLYRYDSTTAEADAELGVVPIGEPYPGMTALIVDDELRPVADGESGELIMTGPQLTLGYWQDPDKTAAAFVVPPGQDRTFYRTGDRVKRARADGPLLYLGRVDNQIKVQGYRVELGEIEALMRELGGTDVAIAVGYPRSSAGAEGIVGFIGDSEIAPEALRAALGDRLPAYMQPSRILPVDTFPLNANGKVDRKALLDSLE
tara:strand:- start:5649 stop:7232 length:1584 start_codon:yes stop_codon:yes gene_type:complete